ncbi:MAG: gamma-glutamyl-gamma-aminobutyrate hydrolase family protein [Verrucomicrobia bacterium]|nr:gamma-glutamyl-gamma-aminobutyrate hydrolase family protein [Verrucomicrobiota bacterium]MBI3868851.1 gamma-glutamyl-gamma-aminobutyrate hydrolase family protein [Verrucomicrobiota bacterium]
MLVAPQTERHAAPGALLRSSLSEAYAGALVAAGAIPLIASCLPEASYVRGAVASVDGVLLTGGDDIDPRLYAPSISPELSKTVEMDGPERDAFELMLINEVMRQRKPLFAICRGMQILNVALGGTLIVDIPTQVPKAIPHRRNDAKSSKVHETDLLPGSLLEAVCRTRCLGVNSTHHQAVDRLAKVLRPTAVSRDGIVEGLELTPRHRGVLPYLLGVQFHPERLWPRYPEHLALFQSFTQVCRRNRQ